MWHKPFGIDFFILFCARLATKEIREKNDPYQATQ